MASNNEYKRYFIILQEDDKGYEMSPGKVPTGYVKIEVKNNKVRLNAFIQNVRIEDQIEYRLILVASNKKLAVDVGKIIIDSSGRGELSHELESDNVLKSGLNIGDFTVAAVASGASVPLSGYTGREKLEWKGKYDIVNRPKEQAPRIDKKITVEEIMPEIPEPITPPQQEIPAPPIAPIEEPVQEQPAAKPEVIVEEVPVKKPEMLVEIPAPVEVMPEPEPEPIPVPEPEPVPVPEPELVPIPIPIPIPIQMPEPEPEPEPVIIVQQPVEHTVTHETNVEVNIVMPQCPPMAPIEEPCEMEKEKIEYEDIKEYYCDDEEDESDRDSDSDSDSDDKKHHEEKHGHKLSPYFSGNMYNKMKRVLKNLRRYEPFEEDDGYRWFKVGEDIYEINSVAIPYMGYMVPMGYPFMSEGCSMMLDKKGYILGVKYNDDDEEDRKIIRYLLFGVPAVYSKRNEQYYRSRGFMGFKPHRSKSHGYFIMCLDINSGMLCHMD